VISAREALASSSELEMTGEEPSLRVQRRRKVLTRGLFRLLIPRVVARVDTSSPVPQVSVLPDALAWFMLVVCMGGLIVEVTMDRAHYPREYPPAFIFGLAAFYVGALGIELIRTRDAVLRAIRT
jgi:hypothetical protein